MTDRPLDQSHPGHPPVGPDDPTRDIRLPPLRDRPPASVPPVPDPIADQPTNRLPPAPDPVRQSTLAFDSPQADVGRPPFGSPPGHPPAPAANPPLPGTPHAGRDRAPQPDRSAGSARRWPWVVLVLLPVVIIVVAGVLLALLLGG